MCILIVCPSGLASLPARHRAASVAGNPDGTGVAWAGGASVSVRRHMAADPTDGVGKKSRHKPALFHARIGTHGVKDVSNCHPFSLGRDPDGFEAVVAHNGILDWPSDALRSDTHAFAADFLTPLHAAGNLFSPGTLSVLESYCGGWNKLALLRGDGEIAIVGEDQGHWLGDCWYSNDSYLGAKRYAGSTLIDDESWRPAKYTPQYRDTPRPPAGTDSYLTPEELALWGADVTPDEIAEGLAAELDWNSRRGYDR